MRDMSGARYGMEGEVTDVDRRNPVRSFLVQHNPVSSHNPEEE
jgi:hypothetical protein